MRRPLIVVERRAQRQWLELVEQGVGRGSIENRIAELLDGRLPGLGDRRFRGATGAVAGRILGDGWIARFSTSDRSPSTGAARIVWTIEHVERRTR